MSLPVCNIPFDSQNFNNLRIVSIGKIIWTIAADCWALVLNDHIVYNAYSKPSDRMHHSVDLVREYIINNPNSIANYKRIQVFLFGRSSWKVVFVKTNYSLWNLHEFCSCECAQRNNKLVMNIIPPTLTIMAAVKTYIRKKKLHQLLKYKLPKNIIMIIAKCW